MTSAVKYIIYFVIFSVLGWLFESCILRKPGLECGNSVTRYFNMCLPLLLVYGVGGMIILYINENFQYIRLLPRVLLATVILVALECLAGLASRAVFNKRTWDYSQDPLPMCDSYISLRVSIFWFVMVFIFYLITEKSV